jgi:hypothetical protein
LGSDGDVMRRNLLEGITIAVYVFSLVLLWEKP